MSTHVQADGYTVGPNGLTDVTVDEVVFTKPTGALTVTPLQGDTTTDFTATVTSQVDPGATPAKVELIVDTKPQPLGGTFKLPAGTHLAGARVTDANGYQFTTAYSTVTVTQVAPPPPPPPPTGLGCIGVSPGAMGTAQALATFKPHVFRAFAPADYAGVPAGTSIVYSNDGGHNRGNDLDGAKVGSAGYNAWHSELGAAFKDTSVPHFFIIGHEEDIHGNDLASLARRYIGGNLVLDDLNKGRTHKIYSVSCSTGMPFDTKAYLDWEQVPAHVRGMDNYSIKHWDTMVAWAAKLGQPFAIPETGLKAGVPASDIGQPYMGDTLIAAAMVKNHPYWLQALFVCYWHGAGNDLRTKPKATAQLQSYIAASGKIAA